jgi:phosphohistidine phosphatase
MKRLSLLRHAKSSWSDPKLADHDRPLSGRGKRTSPRIAAHFAAHECGKPDLIISSSALRALVTANHLATALAERAWHSPVERRAELYMATPKTHLGLVRGLADSLRHVVLVGHNPGLEDFAEMLEHGRRIEHLPTAAIATLEFQAERWSAIAQRAGRCVFYCTPKQLGLR